MPPYPIIHDVVNANREVLIRQIVERQYGLAPGTWNTFGDAGRKKSLRDVGYHLDYLLEALDDGDPSLFIDYAGWVKVLFAGLGFSADVFPTTLVLMQEAFATLLSAEESRVVGGYIAMALSYLQQAPAELPSLISGDSPMDALAREYLGALLNGDRRRANTLIMDAVQGGASVKEIYLQVFQRSQHELGRLWQMNKISVAQEHFCTAATQMIMSRLYPYIFSADRAGRRLVATCVGGELHEIGMRMVTDFFEMEGWDTYYLGANMPAESVLRTIEEHHADILGISATMSTQVSSVERLICAVRAMAAENPVKVIVGGYPFNISTDLWQTVGADGYGQDAQAAIDTASRLLSNGAN